MVLCEFTVDQKWNLVYRASQDGFEATNFHFKFDYKPNSLVVIKSENGNVFGGYTERSWMPEEGEDRFFKADPKSFIFSLTNNENNPLKIKWSENESIGCYNSWGPTFGGSYSIKSDIFIDDKSNIIFSWFILNLKYQKLKFMRKISLLL